MTKNRQNNESPSIQITRSEDIDLPVYEPGGYKGIRVREWANLRKAVSRVSENNSKWETTFNISATSFFTFLIPALTTPGPLEGWKLFFAGTTLLSLGCAIPSYISWRTEKGRTQTESKDILELMNEIDSFYPQTSNSSSTAQETTDDLPDVQQNASVQSSANVLDEDILQEAIKIAYEAGKVSSSMLQRRLRIGYGKAARIVDELEKRGIVGEAAGSHPRTIIGRR